MKRLAGMMGLVVWLAAGSGQAATAPEFAEVYELLRLHLKGVDEAALNQAAVEGLAKQLHPKVTLVPTATSVAADGATISIAKSTVLDKAYGYVRFGQLAAGAAQELRQAYGQMNDQQRLEGLVLDLRFADGINYVAATAVADLFFSKERPLINWGQGVKHSTAKSDALQLPVAVLVNARTSGAAEVLAGMLREGGIGLVLGGATAGQASQYAEFKLKSGQRLRIASGPIQLGGGRPIPMDGLKPDIAVAVSLEDEEIYLEDAYKVIARAGKLAGVADLAAAETRAIVTNTVGDRLNEAELVRRHREGLDLVTNEAAGALSNGPLTPPTVRDPVLARALDLLKGLAVLHAKPNQ